MQSGCGHWIDTGSSLIGRWSALVRVVDLLSADGPARCPVQVVYRDVKYQIALPKTASMTSAANTRILPPRPPAARRLARSASSAALRSRSASADCSRPSRSSACQRASLGEYSGEGAPAVRRTTYPMPSTVTAPTMSLANFAASDRFRPPHTVKSSMRSPASRRSRISGHWACSLAFRKHGCCGSPPATNTVLWHRSQRMGSESVAFDMAQLIASLCALTPLAANPAREHKRTGPRSDRAAGHLRYTSLPDSGEQTISSYD
jgi:hypothetical protein